MATAVKSKKQYSFQQKEQILRDHFDHGLSISAISRKHQVNAVNLYNWKKMLMTSDKSKNSPEIDPKEVAELRRENDALKKAVADLAIEKAILKEALEIFKKKQNPHPAWLRSPKK
jgi:transposase-like protein